MILMEEDLPQSRRRGHAARVLVICEDPVLLTALVRVIAWSRPAYSIEAVTTAADAVAALETRSFNVVLACCEPTGEEARHTLASKAANAPGLARMVYLAGVGPRDRVPGHLDDVVAPEVDLRGLLTRLDAVLDHQRVQAANVLSA
jgi:hypothetical protein